MSDGRNDLDAMMAKNDDDIVRFTAILDQFAAEQRALALAQTAKQKITIVRNIGQICQVNYETVIEQGAPAEEIFRLLEPIDGAIDRLKAKSDLSDHYNLSANDCGQIEMTVKRLAGLRIQFAAENARRGQNRRQEVGLSATQQTSLDEARRTIRELFEKIEERRLAIAECRRVLDGEDPFKILGEQIDKRLDALRGNRADAA
jgi:hypothetical protein